MYDPPDNEAVQVTAHAAVSKVPAAAVTPDIPFTPTFAIPSSVKSHLPRTDRMHKVCNCSIQQDLHKLILPRQYTQNCCCCRSFSKLQNLYAKLAGRQSLCCVSSKLPTLTLVFWSQMMNSIHTSDGWFPPDQRSAFAAVAVLLCH